MDRQEVLEKVRALGSWNTRRLHYASSPSKRRKLSIPICGACQSTLRPFACLHCSFFGCWPEGHIKEHLEETGHNFCVDVKTGFIYCNACSDFVYDSAAARTFAIAAFSAEDIIGGRKKSRQPFEPWKPNQKETVILETAISMPCQARRGLLNLGNTCFMNAILQSFIVNPLLRDYFLSDKHNHLLCKNKDCTCCEMDKLFSEMYSENATPYGPASFLATTWRASAELSGYAQQDAHEFFMAALNHIHSTSRGSTKLSCICIIHSTFAGLLQSDVKCGRCSNVTTASDPMLDISLELQDKGSGGHAGHELTLASCLRRFTQPEKLGPNEYSCAKCGKTSHDTNKRLSLRKLPPVLSFQFKRFEHKSGDKTAAQKIEAPVRFPSNINMAPYTSLGMAVREQEGNNGAPDSASSSVPGPGSMYEYELFAVVCHEGQINNGHYTCFARSQDEWYRFDDDKMSHSSLRACLNSLSQAYMCFYVKKHLDYKPYVTPSYKVAREAEAVKEKQREREKEAARMREVEDALLATVY
ncbi:cysteine proteinase [Daedalea quercina L-15889]|uniref:Ubiquitin carboxyl-terminal hydrolase n=1 Tax=Daedalea quercina L-15889 TaxID=1314783 RepID=A0A165TKB0_9APHY|nr:cysteine proteinase [Daedalea quercina L-15889]